MTKSKSLFVPCVLLFVKCKRRESFIYRSRCFRSCHQTCYIKKAFLEILQNSQENTCTRVSFLIKLPQACNFIKKETLAQTFYCEVCEISKNTFFHKTPLVAVSESNRYSFCNRNSFTKSSVLTEAVVQRCS